MVIGLSSMDIALTPDQIKVITDLIEKGAIVEIGDTGLIIRKDPRDKVIVEEVLEVNVAGLPDKDFQYLAKELNKAFYGKAYFAVELIAYIFVREMLYLKYKKRDLRAIISDPSIRKELSKNMKDVLRFFEGQKIIRDGLEHIKGVRVSEPEALATMRMVKRFLELL